MLNLTTNQVRIALCLAAMLVLSACASTTTPEKLSKGEAADASRSLYTGQLPELAEANSIVDRLERELSDAPRDPQAYLRLGVAYRHVERFDEALRVFEQAAQLSDLPYVARNEIGILYRAQGNFDKAANIYLTILGEAPDFFDAHFNLGILYDLYLRQPLAAQKHYQAYIANAPEVDDRVQKWLGDLERRYQIDASASAGVVGE